MFSKKINCIKIFVTILLTISFSFCRDTELKQKALSDPTGPFGILIGILAMNMYNTSPTNSMGSLGGMTKLSDRILVYGGRGLIFESTDGLNFTKYKYKIPDCTSATYPGSGIPTCKILYVGYENGNYMIIGGKVTETYSTSSSTATTILYSLKTTSLVDGTTLSPLTTSITVGNFFSGYYKSGILHMIVNSSTTGSSAYKMYTSTDGASWTETGFTDGCTFYHDGTRSICGGNRFHNGTSWVNSSPVGVGFTSYSSNNAMFNNSLYLVHGSSGIYTTSGPITGSATYTLRQAISGGSSNALPTLAYNGSKYILFTYSSSGSGNSVTTTITIYSSTDGLTWTSGSATGISTSYGINNPAIWTYGGAFYLVLTDGSEVKTFKSTNGTTWTTVDLGIR